MELRITADFKVTDPSSLRKIDQLGDLEALESRIHECITETCVGTLRGGIDYKLRFLRPTPFELKQALIESRDSEQV